MSTFHCICTVLACTFACSCLKAAVPFIETPVSEDEWGFHPADQETVMSNPPPFAWKTQGKDVVYELQLSRQADCSQPQTIPAIRYPLYCAPEPIAAGQWYWRVRCTPKDAEPSAWSSIRSFAVAENAYVNPMPPMKTLLARIPASHPRIFIRPEQLPDIRKRLTGDLKPIVDKLLGRCDNMLATPLSTAEPLKYTAAEHNGNKAWRDRWWGNRLFILKVLGGASELGYAWQLTQDQRYAREAKRILLECARWDPQGATSLTYNDEAGMPYLSRFSRTYSYIQDVLTEDERALCRAIIRQRGQEAARRLYPRHFSRPYNSHNNRLWHFLGEAGVVFHGEIPEASSWLEGAMNVYFCAYPVWGDDDGGWHEGPSYWYQYLERFFWWGDILKNTFQLDIAQKPFYHRTGDYALYQMPPRSDHGGFADLGHLMKTYPHRGVMYSLAACTGNPYYQWYAQSVGTARPEDAYIAILRALGSKTVAPKPPDDLPTSKLFAGNGLAFLNTTLVNGDQNTQIQFKSSPSGGTYSHGYDANNSFLLNYLGKRLLIRSGKRDNYGSNFHKNWMWHTKSENNITVNGFSQVKGKRAARGRITAFETTPEADYVCGNVGDIYEGHVLTSYQRQILFLKPAAIVIVDTLKAPRPVIFNWHLHAINTFEINGLSDIRAHLDNAHCRIEFITPTQLKLSQTDQFDPEPMPKTNVNQYHFTADTVQPATDALFVTVIRPYQNPADVSTAVSQTRTEAGLLLDIPVGNALFKAQMDAGTNRLHRR